MITNATALAMAASLLLLCSCQPTADQSSYHFDATGAEATMSVIQAIHDHADRDSVERLLDEALLLEAYQVSNERYTNPRRSSDNQVTLPQYKTFMLSYLDGAPNTQGNRRLAIQEEAYADAIQHPGKYAEAIRVVRSIPEADFEQAFRLALHWSPEGTTLKAYIWVLFDIGGSGGWQIRARDGRDHIGFNVLFLLDEDGRLDRDLFLGTLAHELQHMTIPLDGYHEAIAYSELPDTSTLKLYSDFLSAMIKEGLATKFCSNAPGRFSGKVDPDRPFAAKATGVENWEYFQSELLEIHGNAVNGLRKILDGQVDDVQAFNTEYRNYWTWQAGELEGKQFHMGRRYYYGAELLGAIHEALGRDAVFEVVADLRRLPARYNEALEQLRPENYRDYTFPEDIIAKIGEL